MDIAPHEPDVLSKIVRWVAAQDLVRAALLTSSRANPQAPRDILSDYDVAMMVSDVEVYVKDQDWPKGYGQPLLQVRDSEHEFGMQKYNCMVLYNDGTKIDYSI